MDHKHVVEKIRKLLALARSTNEHEAAAAAAKAQELLSAHNLKIADVPTDELSNTMRVAEAHQKTRQRLEAWAYQLAHIVSAAFDCRYYHNPEAGRTTFLGVGPDPEVCGWTYSFLYKTLLRMASAYLHTPCCRRLRSEKSRKNARESWLLGACAAIHPRLARQKQETPITPGTLVVAKAAAISAAMPELISRPVRKRRLREDDFYNGMRAGRAIPLASPIPNTSQRGIC